MKKISILLLCVLFVALTGCSEDTKNSAVGVYDSLKDFGKDLYNDVDNAVNSYTTPKVTMGIAEEYDVLAEKVKSISNSYTVTGTDILSIISGIKSTDLTVLIQLKEDETAYVVGKLVTCDGCEYVEEINELPETDGIYTYDFCEMNGIIRSTISSMASRKYTVYRYDKQCTNIKRYADLTNDNYFDVLNLYEDGKLCGFYFSERSE